MDYHNGEIYYVLRKNKITIDNVRIKITRSVNVNNFHQEVKTRRINVRHSRFD